jgi:hypothetical protein
MWVSKLFTSLLVLVDFVNERRLPSEQFKVVVVPPRLWQRRSGPRYYLLYRVEEGASRMFATIGTQRAVAIDEGAAVDTAEAIIANAKSRGSGTGGMDA